MGLPVPVVAAGSVDETVQQVVALLNEGIADICDRYAWQVKLTVFKDFNRANGPDYLALDLAADLQV